MGDVIVFDVNETLLDLSALDPFFGRVFGAASIRERWFRDLEVLVMVGIATGHHEDFGLLAGAALEMTADREGVELSAGEVDRLLGGLKSLPPHGDVSPGLARLRGAGRRLAALTNGTSEAVRAQLKHAGLEGMFEGVFSADEARRHKPSPEPYRMAAERLGVEPGAMLMVAAHDWDLAGARAAGLKTAFVARPRKVLSPIGPRPDLHAADLVALADRLIAAGSTQTTGEAS